MVELNYKTLESYLRGFGKGRGRKAAPSSPRGARVYLIYGEEVLCKAAFRKLLDALVPGDGQRFNYEPVDGTAGGVPEALEKLNTFSLLAGPKVVALTEARLFDAAPDAGRLLYRARQAHAEGNLHRAAADVLRLMSLSNLTFEDLDRENRRRSLPALAESDGQEGWLDDILAFCRADGRDVPPAADSENALCRAIEKGFPDGHHLLITTDTIDKRKRLFKMIRDLGVAVDCLVPKGDRKADKKIQEAVLRETMSDVLDASGVAMDEDGFTALQEMTGFDIRTFKGNLKKLVDFVGDRRRITRADVAAALERTKKDPVYALTGALAARNLEEALFFTGTLMSGGLETMRPEQILVALLNQVRKLLRVKEFMGGSSGSAWFAGCPYHHFTASVLPVVQQFDAALVDQLGRWHAAFLAAPPEEMSASPPKGAKKKKPPATDLLIVRNPNNPYPVYQLFLAAENYTKRELLQAFEHLSMADLRIKSGGGNKQLILEEAIFAICRRAR
ncbi:MAG: hypothetical protein WCD88_14160 [Desulfobacterales bacterium]